MGELRMVGSGNEFLGDFSLGRLRQSPRSSGLLVFPVTRLLALLSGFTKLSVVPAVGVGALRGLLVGGARTLRTVLSQAAAVTRPGAVLGNGGY